MPKISQYCPQSPNAQRFVLKFALQEHTESTKMKMLRNDFNSFDFLASYFTFFSIWSFRLDDKTNNTILLISSFILFIYVKRQSDVKCDISCLHSHTHIIH